MGLDTLLKRYFVVVVLGLIAVAAYFQAAGAMQCVGSKLAVDPSELTGASSSRAPVVVPAATTTNLHAQTGEAIIERNPFDSVTGPLNKQDAGGDDGGGSAPVDFSNPYSAPACSGDTKLLIIAAADDPSWSMAAIGGGQTGGKTQMRRIGDSVGAKRIWYIAWDRVWLQGEGELCQIQMFKSQAEASKAAPVSPPTPAPVASGAPPRGATSVPADIASKIQKVSATEFNVDRSVVDRILENQAELMRSARIVPEQENGKVVGIRLFGIRPDTLLGTLGMENGDRLDSINGFNMASPEKALEAYARLRTADHLTVTINRRGKPMNIDFNIK